MDVKTNRSDKIDRYQDRIDRISKLLKKRLAVYPKRDGSYLQLCEAVEEFSEYLRGELDQSNFNPDPKITRVAERFSESPLFICGPMKSGTSLLSQLLDNHPDLLVMPGDSHYVHNREAWERRQFDKISTFWLKRLINPTGKNPFWFIGPDRIQLETFLQYLRYFLSDTRMDAFVCVIMAVYAANCDTPSPSPKKYWVEKTPHNELYAEMLKARFPDAKFIHILRDPLENIVSLNRMSEIRGQDSTSYEYAFLLRKLFRASRKNHKKFGEKTYHILKYEDLVAETERVLHDVCVFLNISFNKTLLEPTENGRPGVSNSMFPETMVKGRILDLSRKKRFEAMLHESEIRDIVTTLYQEAVGAGYGWNNTGIEHFRRPWCIRYLHNLKTRIKLRISRI